MNERERDRFEDMIASLSEIKAEIVGMARQLERINGSVARHFEEDKQWMARHDKDKAHAAGFKAGAFWILGGATSAAVVIATVATKIVLGD